MAKTFTKEVSKYIRSGLKNRTKEEQQNVIGICKLCKPYFVEKTTAGPRCKRCGCCISLAKRWKTKHCPIGKW